jgi:hypothetical protein
MIVAVIVSIWASLRIYRTLKSRSQTGAAVAAITTCVVGIAAACYGFWSLGGGPDARDVAGILVLGAVLFLAVTNALRISRKTLVATAKLGRVWAWLVATIAFAFTFIVFTIAMGLVASVFFGR